MAHNRMRDNEIIERAELTAQNLKRILEENPPETYENYPNLKQIYEGIRALRGYVEGVEKVLIDTCGWNQETCDRLYNIISGFADTLPNSNAEVIREFYREISIVCAEYDGVEANDIDWLYNSVFTTAYRNVKNRRRSLMNAVCDKNEKNPGGVE